MDIQGFLHRFADKTVTDTERAEFAQYLQTLSPAAYEDLMDQFGEIVRVSGYSDAGDLSLFSRITASIDVLEEMSVWPGADQPIMEDEKYDPGRRRHLKMLYWAGAAAACILLMTGIYLISRTSHQASKAATSAVDITSSIAPGNNKAILTLGNGSQIILDSTAKGKLAAQGSMEVVKLMDGTLKYQAAGNTASNIRSVVLYNTLSTPRGGQFQLVLPDGTKVWLNAASHIKYPTVFAGKTREVVISGEAYFEVARDNEHPFKVNITGQHDVTGKEAMGVEVLGTDFNVNAYMDEADDQVRTTLLDGSVRVVIGSKQQLIRPGQQASVSFINPHFEVQSEVNLKNVMAWKNGKMVFNKGDIRELMFEISRWYDVDVKYNGVIPSGKFYGLLDRNVPLSSLLRVLNAYGVATELKGKTVIVQ